MMENTQQPRPRKAYITSRLKNLAAQMADYPVVVLSAPMGCGKTVAAGYLARHFKGQAFRINVSTYNPETFWKNLCKQLAPGCSPDASPALLAGAVCARGPVLILIDDYQKAQSPQLSQRLLDMALALPERLKLVICSRYLVWAQDSIPVCLGQVLLIDDRDLRLEEKEILPFCRSCQVRVTTAQAKTLYSASEGWMVALFLMLTDYVKNGTLRIPGGLPHLLLSQVQQLKAPLGEFVTRLAPAGAGFTLEQASFLWPQGDAQALLDQLLAQGFYLQYDLYTQEYHFYPLLCATLCSQIIRSPQRQSIYLAHGQWHQQQGQIAKALAAYAHGLAFDQLLRGMDSMTAAQAEALEPTQAREWFAACPPQQLVRHPNALLHFLWLFSCYGMEESALARELFLQAKGQLTHPELVAMLSNTFLLMEGCLSCQPEELIAKIQQLEPVLKAGGSLAPLSFRGGMYGSPSLLAIWGRDEDVAQSADLIAQAEVSGAAPAMALAGLGDAAYGEAMYYMGNLKEAQICTHRILRRAQQENSPHLTLAAGCLQARLLFANGKLEKLQGVLSQLNSQLRAAEPFPGLYTYGLELLEGLLWAISQHPGQPVSWLREETWEDSFLPLPLRPFALACHALILVRLGRHTQAVSLEQELTQPQLPTIVRLYGLLALACASRKLGHTRRVAQYLSDAIDLAKPGQLVMPFVELYPQLKDLLAESKPDWEPLQELIPDLGDQFGSTIELPAKLAVQNPAGLTAREVEIATLAAGGMYNREISQKLDISENTIKSTLKNIFAKLDIHSRRELPDALARMAGR